MHRLTAPSNTTYLKDDLVSLNANMLLLYIFSVITMIAIPGPVALLVTGAGLAKGPWQALKTILGTNAASLVLIALSALVVNGILSVNELLFCILKLLGACYISYIGWDVWQESKHDIGEEAVKAEVGGAVKGFLVAISNPKDIIFFASFFPQFLGVTSAPVASLVLLTVVWVILDFSTLMMVYLFIRKISKPSIHKKLLQCSGIILIVVAVLGIFFSLRDMQTLL